MEAPSTKYLVVDSGALIKGVRLERLAQSFYTVQEVFDEVRDKQAREFLHAFPFEIKVREPHPDAFKQVVEFSKKTGDFTSLSAVDLKVLSLTLTLEREINGDKTIIRTTPNLKVNVQDRTTLHRQSKPSLENPENTNVPSSESDSMQEEDSTSTNESDAASVDSQNSDKKKKRIVSANNGIVHVDDDDDRGWITPDNIAEVNAQISGEFEPATNTNVGCITTDFAMQNVLLQMGLKLISVEGLRIKTVKNFVLKCFSCFKATQDKDKVFCPSCGNNTLWKVPVTVDENGNITHYHNFKKKPSVRGTKYSIPLPKGGKKNQDIILCEDQWMQAVKKNRRPKGNGITDPFDLDYSFAAGQSGKHGGVQIGYGKRNPNVAKKRVGKKNKPIHS